MDGWTKKVDGWLEPTWYMAHVCFVVVIRSHVSGTNQDRRLSPHFAIFDKFSVRFVCANIMAAGTEPRCHIGFLYCTILGYLKIWFRSNIFFCEIHALFTT